jgi:hypothetical protein
MKKGSRNGAHVGNWRWYLTPHALIPVSDLPEGWGLIEILGSDRVRRVRQADFSECDDKAQLELALQEYRASQLVQMEHIYFSPGLKPDLMVLDARSVIRKDTQRVRNGDWVGHWWEDASQTINVVGYGI